jgi:drug/metabolite transporter (DMT)-like permease
LEHGPVSPLRLGITLTIGVLAVSFAAVFIRLAQAEGMPTVVIAAWRLVFACSILVPYALARHGKEIRSGSSKEWGLMFLAGLFLGLHFAAWIGSLGFTSVASSVVLVSMGPVFVALGSWIILGERPSGKTLAGIGFAVIGMLIIGWSDFGKGSDTLKGDLLALSGALFVAGYLIAGRKVRPGRSLLAYVAPVYFVAMVTLLLTTVIMRQPLLGCPAGAYGWALLLALLPQLIGHTTINWALARLSATFVAVLTLAEPVGSSVFAWILLDEPVALWTAVGAVPLFAGIYIASRAELANGEAV